MTQELRSANHPDKQHPSLAYKYPTSNPPSEQGMDLHSSKTQAGILGKHVFQAFGTSARWQEFYHGGIFQPELLFPHNIHCLLLFC